MQSRKLVLIAGPYRSGTGDDPDKIRTNVRAMEEMAYQVYQRGHTPVLGEWLALPILKEAGSKQTGDAVYQQLFHPIAIRLIEHCDVIFRIGAASEGADEMVRIGKHKGKTIIFDLSELSPTSA